MCACACVRAAVNLQAALSLFHLLGVLPVCESTTRRVFCSRSGRQATSKSAQASGQPGQAAVRSFSSLLGTTRSTLGSGRTQPDSPAALASVCSVIAASSVRLSHAAYIEPAQSLCNALR